MNNRPSTILVSIVIGDSYREIYDAYFKKSHEDFAKRNGYDFLVIYEPIAPSSKHPAWQKLLIFRHPEVARYDRAMFIDADIYITKKAGDPLSLVPDGYWGLSDNNAYGMKSLAESDRSLYFNCPPDYQPPLMLNTGLFIVEKKKHREMLERIFSTYPEQNCYENGPLSYHIQKEFKDGVVLPPTYNAILAAYRMRYGKELSRVVEFYEANGFIHFAGGLPLFFARMLIILETRPNSLSARLIKIFGKRTFNPVTTIVLRATSLILIIKKKLWRKSKKNK